MYRMVAWYNVCLVEILFGKIIWYNLCLGRKSKTRAKHFNFLTDYVKCTNLYCLFGSSKRIDRTTFV